MSEMPSVKSTEPKRDPSQPSQYLPTVVDFFKQFTAYHIMPTSARVLAIDSDTTIYRAFRIMGDNLVSSSYIWDRRDQLYSSVLTATDIMRVSLVLYNKFFAKDSTLNADTFAAKNNIQPRNPGGAFGIYDFLNVMTVRSIKSKNSLQFTYTTTTLFDAIQKMFTMGVHRLPIFDNDGSIILTLTYRTICRFLVSKFRFQSGILKQPIMDPRLGIVQTSYHFVYNDDNLYTAVNALVQHNLSMVPVVTRSGELYDVFSKYDFSCLNAESQLNLDERIDAAIAKRPKDMEGLVVTSANSTIGAILRQIADRNLHRILLVDDQNSKKLVGVVSLRYVLKYLVSVEIYDSGENITEMPVESVTEPKGEDEDELLVINGLH